MHALRSLGFDPPTDTVRELMLTVTSTKHLHTLYMGWTLDLCFTYDELEEWLPKLDTFMIERHVASLGLWFNCLAVNSSKIEERLSDNDYRIFEGWLTALFPLMCVALKVIQIPMIAV